MTDYLALPPAREVRGVVVAPPSKSATNRALVLAALSEETVEIARPLFCGDTSSLSRCLSAMGASIHRSPGGLRVHGPLSAKGNPEVTLDAGESGTAARFLTALAAATPGRFRLTAAPRLLERPIAELVAALRSRGAEIEYLDAQGCLPLSIRGGHFQPGSVAVDASRSSQFLSALLLVGAAFAEGVEVSATGEIVSAPYVTTTLETLKAFGHQVTEGSSLQVARGSRRVERYHVPGDFSSAVPLLAAVGVAGGDVTVEGLTWPSEDADASAVAVLERMGVAISAGPRSLRASCRPGRLSPVCLTATDFPDAVPALAALAALAPGRSRFEGIGHLRWKESDRIAACASLVSGAG
ncbi:MAG TPA: 3-phosphoshikimate 1-carboxyvinyltransferase, partial [Thermoanaerobaculia bacterium]|nr:3-phosphoshikimate 1-carboxyvinyltransferase [Thermoanaerobaculia bacterium]